MKTITKGICASLFVRISDAPQPLTLRKWNELIDSPRVKHLIAKNRNGDSTAKRKLPAITWQATFKGSRRSNDEAIPTGLYMLDIDHIKEDVRTLVEQKVTPHIAQCGIMVVHITPSGKGSSGKGLRIVARMLKANGFATIAEHQKWLATTLGFNEYDACTKDLSRLSFVVTRDDVIYFDEKLFCTAPEFVIENPALHNKSVAIDVPNTHNTTMQAQKAQDVKTTVAQNEMNTPVATSCQTDYRGISLRKIAETLILQLFPQGVFEGSRNNCLFRIACLMRYITDFNAQVIALALPDLGLTQAEVLQLCTSALQQKRTMWLPKELKRALNALNIHEDDDITTHGDDEATTAVDDDADDDYFANQLCSPCYYSFHVPKMPPLFDLFVGKVSTKLKAPQALAMLPIVGALASRIRSKCFKEEPCAPSFLTIIYAPQASGKSFVSTTYKRLTRDILKADKEAEAVERDYLYRSTHDKEGNVKDPKPVIRLMASTTSIAQLMRRNDCANGLHLLTYTPEIDTLTSSKKRGAWADVSSYDRVAFDNDIYTQSFLNSALYSSTVTVYHNKVMCGTPKAVDRYIPDYEDGLASRVIFVPLQTKIGDKMPKFDAFTDEEERIIDRFVCRLMNDFTHYELDFLKAAIDNFSESMRLEAEKRDDRALDTFYKRSGEIGFRAGLVAAACFAADDQLIDDERVRQVIVNFALWVAHFTMSAQMERYASQIDEDSLQERTPMRKAPGFYKLYKKLSKTFTRQDLEEQRRILKIDTNATNILWRWKKDKYIEEVADSPQTYKKANIDKDKE